MSCISSRVKVPQIQRQGLDTADSDDWDLNPHLNICALSRLFILVAICMNMKTLVFWDLFVFYLCFYFIIIKLNFLACIRWLI